MEHELNASRGIWHSGGSVPDENEHLTVDFKNNGEHVTTHHVYRPGGDAAKK